VPGLHPFLDAPTPIVVAHRGASGDAPENTLEAFQAAIDQGCRYLETDAHVTKDGVVVAFHDHRLDRATDRRGAIEELTIAEVEQADAGHHLPAFRHQGVKVPRLEEVLTRWPDARVIIDPKTDRATEPVCALLDRLDAWDRVCLGAFSDRRVERVRQLSGGRACTSMGPRATATAVLVAAASGRMPRQGADCLQVPIRDRGVRIVTARFVRAAHRAGLPVQVWTVDQPRTMHYLLDLGVDAIMTNRPRVLFDVLAVRAAGAART
jgi:glycerophosphoryl diester phosphodiesterase